MHSKQSNRSCIQNADLKEQLTALGKGKADADAEKAALQKEMDAALAAKDVALAEG